MKPGEIAQWVIDNRYPKSEHEKIGDAEMYHTIIEKINQVLLLTAVSGAERKVCPKCSDFGTIDNLDGTISTCPCHY
jgi:hypothetical protein